MRRLVGALTVAAVALAGCDSGQEAPERAGGAIEGSLTVFAAASLAGAFTELAVLFEADHPGTDVTLNFGASSSLREQIISGAPADVFASADRANIDDVIEAGQAIDSTAFATNRLAIAVPEGNPAGVTGLADFADDELVLGLCASTVPCGTLARAALERAGVVADIDTEAPDVRALVTQVRTGDLDAGLVYATDVLAADGAVDGIEIPTEEDASVVCSITRLTDGPAPVAAAAFLALVGSAQGQTVLARYGFGRA